LWNKTTTEIRFFISSLAADAQKHAEVIRRHWSIENIAIPIVVRYRVLGFEESGVRIQDSGFRIQESGFRIQELKMPVGFVWGMERKT